MRELIKNAHITVKREYNTWQGVSFVRSHATMCYGCNDQGASASVRYRQGKRFEAVDACCSCEQGKLWAERNE